MKENKEAVEIRDALSELRKLETELQQAVSNVATITVVTWNEMVNFRSGSKNTKKNVKEIDDLRTRTAEIYSSLSLLLEKVKAGLKNEGTENGIAIDAINNLPELLEKLLKEAGDLRLHLSMIQNSLEKVRCPARIIRRKLAQVLLMPTVGTDDLILQISSSTQSDLNDK